MGTHAETYTQLRSLHSKHSSALKNHGKGSGFMLKRLWKDVLAQNKEQEHRRFQDPGVLWVTL